mgnify:CR=1 FL=1|tara:strand:- start:416 stop:655 length:240 start_codon:yes stop_codon:yes gene_type:complete
MANYTSAHTGNQVDNAVTKVKDSSVTQSDLSKLHSLTATATEINQLDDKTVGGTNNDDIVDVASSQSLSNKTLDGGTFI